MTRRTLAALASTLGAGVALVTGCAEPEALGTSEDPIRAGVLIPAERVPSMAGVGRLEFVKPLSSNASGGLSLVTSCTGTMLRGAIQNGALAGRRLVLTARHCLVHDGFMGNAIDDDSRQIVTPGWTIQFLGAPYGSGVTGARTEPEALTQDIAFFPHADVVNPDPDGPERFRDMAVVAIADPTPAVGPSGETIPWSEFTYPVEETLSARTALTIFGAGVSESSNTWRLREGSLPWLRRDPAYPSWFFFQGSTAANPNLQNSCSGDSGGPVLQGGTNTEFGKEVIAIMTRGFSSCAQASATWVERPHERAVWARGLVQRLGVYPSFMNDPQVRKIAVGYDERFGSPQRSRVRAARIAVTTPLVPGADVTAALRLSSSAGRRFRIEGTASADGTYIDVRFGALPNGDYTLTVDGAVLRTADGHIFDAEGRGTLGSTLELAFHRLACDLDGDHQVSRDELRRIAKQLNQSPSTPEEVAMDVDGDGRITLADLAACMRRPRGDDRFERE